VSRAAANCALTTTPTTVAFMPKASFKCRGNTGNLQADGEKAMKTASVSGASEEDRRAAAGVGGRRAERGLSACLPFMDDPR
jgi:hypothetical protein